MKCQITKTFLSVLSLYIVEPYFGIDFPRWEQSTFANVDSDFSVGFLASLFDQKSNK